MRIDKKWPKRSNEDPEGSLRFAPQPV
ncbi:MULTISPECIES: hypothetical protein [Pseudescherichia]